MSCVSPLSPSPKEGTFATCAPPNSRCSRWDLTWRSSQPQTGDICPCALPKLTAEGWCPPTPHGDSGILARGDIALDTLAQDMRVPSSHTEVMDAGLGIWDWVNDAMAGAKGTFGGREEATVVGFLEDCHFLLCAGGTLILGTGVIARCIHCFPCGSKGCHIWSQLATGELEIIIALAIVVATEATQVPHVDLGHRDHHVLDEVIVDNEAKVSAEQDTCPMWVDLDLSLAQDGGEVVGDGIHLG